MDVIKQTKYWIETAEDDLHTAEILINNRKLLHGLFFCHLSIEKAIKAHIVHFTLKVPARSHNLFFLIGLADLNLNDAEKDLCSLLMAYHIEGRYPDNYPVAPSMTRTKEIFTKTKTLLQCLKAKL